MQIGEETPRNETTRNKNQAEWALGFNFLIIFFPLTNLKSKLKGLAEFIGHAIHIRFNSSYSSGSSLNSPNSNRINSSPHKIRRISNFKVKIRRMR
jgi:hypothetical protein